MLMFRLTTIIIPHSPIENVTGKPCRINDMDNFIFIKIKRVCQQSATCFTVIAL